jgi:ATP-dependent DNA helicase RecG
VKRAIPKGQKQAAVSAAKERTPVQAASNSKDSSSASRLTPHPSLSFATPAVRDRLARLGIFQLTDLVLHLPLRYEDETRIVSIHDALSGTLYRSRHGGEDRGQIPSGPPTRFRGR